MRIYTLKREIAEVRRAVLPLREPMRRFASGSVTGIDPAAAPFFRDVSDHLSRTADIIDTLDSLLSTAFDAHLARISVQQNEDMRKISAGAAIVVVPTLIAGVYGMNFEHMPELGWTLGYPFALAADGRRHRLGAATPASRSPAGSSGSGAQDAGAEQDHRGQRRARSGRSTNGR